MAATLLPKGDGISVDTVKLTTGEQHSEVV